MNAISVAKKAKHAGYFWGWLFVSIPLHLKIVLGSQIVLTVPTHPAFASPGPVTPLSVSFIYSNTTLCIWRTSALLMVRTRTARDRDVQWRSPRGGRAVALQPQTRPRMNLLWVWSNAEAHGVSRTWFLSVSGHMLACYANSHFVMMAKQHHQHLPSLQVQSSQRI